MSAMTTTYDQPATMRDGITLRADIYRPDGAAELPVLLCRTPYDKRSDRHVHDARALAARGYIVVNQDIRGRYSSDGDWAWMFGDQYREAEDGYDTVEWAARLPGSSGKIGTFGLSYDAWLQWELARLRPPHLVAMVPVGIGPRLLDLNYAVFETGRRLRWCYGMAADNRRRAHLATGPFTREEANERWNTLEREKWCWFLPFDDLPMEEIFFGLEEQLRTYLQHQNAEYWHFPAAHSEVDVPVLGITGWYDRLIGVIDHFSGMRANGRSEHARRNQKLLIGPWGHTTDLSRQVGIMDFGDEAALSYHDLLQRWFDHWLKDLDTGIMDEAPVRRFVMGENRWHAEESWPPAGVTFTEFYLQSDGHANTPLGDGRLGSRQVDGEATDSYTYDPRDPVMSLCAQDMQDAPCDQRPLDGRQDVLVYITEPLKHAVEVTGSIVVTLWAASSAPDTDFTAKLVDVHPDGFAVGLCYGIVRAQYRESYTEPSLITPGQAVEYRISMRATSNLFKPGHRIRLDISSSNFPFFDRNHNSGKPFHADSELVVARQTVYHTEAMPSRVTLPIVRRS